MGAVIANSSFSRPKFSTCLPTLSIEDGHIQLPKLSVLFEYEPMEKSTNIEI